MLHLVRVVLLRVRMLHLVTSVVLRLSLLRVLARLGMLLGARALRLLTLLLRRGLRPVILLLRRGLRRLRLLLLLDLCLSESLLGVLLAFGLILHGGLGALGLGGLLCGDVTAERPELYVYGVDVRWKRQGVVGCEQLVLKTELAEFVLAATLPLELLSLLLGGALALDLPALLLLALALLFDTLSLLLLALLLLVQPPLLGSLLVRHALSFRGLRLPPLLLLPPSLLRLQVQSLPLRFFSLLLQTQFCFLAFSK